MTALSREVLKSSFLLTLTNSFTIVNVNLFAEK